MAFLTSTGLISGFNGKNFKIIVFGDCLVLFFEAINCDTTICNALCFKLFT